MMIKSQFTKQNKERARAFITERVNHFNGFYNFEINRIAIRNQRTRWGSCSKKRNLNFNYKVLFLDSKVADYLIVHELCHLGEFNHSKNFWALVAKTIPDYKNINKELRKTSLRSGRPKRKGLIFFVKKHMIG